MIVALDGTGDFNNLQEAVGSIPEKNKERILINIKKGIYKQKVRITKPYITIIGEDAENTVLTFDDTANTLFPNGEKMGTGNSYSISITGHDFIAENITFENSAGPGDIVGQAVAVYAYGDRVKFKNCRFLGHQDTLYTGKPLEGNFLAEIKEGRINRTSRQYYENCFIKGDIDFIFGSATAVFNSCEIFSNNRNAAVNGFVTAAATPEGNDYGYIFIDCRLTGDAAPHSVYLGRPWRDFAKTTYINCWMGPHIIPEGWDNWNKPHAEKLVNYAEYNSSGPGAAEDKREAWSKKLTDAEAKEYSISKVLAGKDNWRP